MVSTRRRVQTSWISGRMLQPPIEPVVANSSVSSDFLAEGQVSGYGTVHPLFTLNFLSTCFDPHEKWMTLSSVMVGRQKRGESGSSNNGSSGSNRVAAIIVVAVAIR